MRHGIKLLAIALLGWMSAALSPGHGLAGAPAFNLVELTDDEVRAAIIKQSIEQYSGNCPCPYNVDRAGRQCGGRSAWSRRGGAAPLCFPADVTADMIRKWRAQNSVG